MIKELFIDTETVGLDSRKHCIHQISCQLYIDGLLKDKLNLHISPHEQSHIDLEALKHCGLTLETIMAYPSRKIQSLKFFNFLRKYVNRYDKTDKMFWLGYNSHFDTDFMRKFMAQNGEKYFGSYFWSGSIDIMVLAQEYLKNDRHKMENFKQGTVAKWLGIEVDDSKLHNSLYDIQIMREIYLKVKCKNYGKTK